MNIPPAQTIFELFFCQSPLQVEYDDNDLDEELSKVMAAGSAEDDDEEEEEEDEEVRAATEKG